MSAFSFECVKSHADSHVLHGVSPQDGTQSEGVYRIDALKAVGCCKTEGLRDRGDALCHF